MSPLDRRPGSSEDPWVGLGLVLAVGVFGLGMVVWGIGQLAGLAFGQVKDIARASAEAGYVTSRIGALQQRTQSHRDCGGESVNLRRQGDRCE